MDMQLYSMPSSDSVCSCGCKFESSADAASTSIAYNSKR